MLLGGRRFYPGDVDEPLGAASICCTCGRSWMLRPESYSFQLEVIPR